ncbi:MAG: glycosyltransferase family 4 protein [Magnetococcales bacterium]|nr:glycosyltransferase family 4 protein [Magnetococcales bacterium]
MTTLHDRPLRIAHSESSLGWGGQELRTLTEAAGMIARGHQVTLLTPPQAKIYQAARQRTLPVEAVRITRKSLPGLWDLWRWLRHNPVDCLISHSSVDSWLAAVSCRLLARPPVIIRLRHISAAVPRNMATRWLYTRGCHHIVTTGEALRQQLINDNGFPGERITSIPTGIDLQRFCPGSASEARQSLALPEDKLIIGIVATLRSWKGHSYLLQAVAALQRQDIHVLIIGDGPQRHNLQQQIASLQLTTQVTLAGNQENVVPWLQACDLFALPSYANEGVPQSLMQAMACGIPAISTPVGSIGELIEEGVTGLLVPPKDAAALQQALQTLLDNPALRHTLGQHGLACIQHRFALPQMVEQMEQIIRQTLRTFRHPEPQAIATP